jgi:hypothetical protein
VVRPLHRTLGLRRAETARSAVDQALVHLSHESEFRLACGRCEDVLPGSCLCLSGLTALVEERLALASVLLGVAESSTFCGPASGQPGNCHGSRQRHSVILCRVAPSSVGSSFTGKQPMQKLFTVSASSRSSSPAALQGRPAVLSLSAALTRPRPNPSVKGTSCGKPQAAPYVER